MKPTFQYLSYVLRHKWFVFKAGIFLKVPVWQLLIHDWTKFLPSEWYAYRNYFYKPLKIGDTIFIEFNDGVSKPAEIVAIRKSPTHKFKVLMSDRKPEVPFWAHNDVVFPLNDYKEKFNIAWNHHQKRNKHHWQYWLLTGDDGQAIALDIPEKYIREMVADWMGAGRAINGYYDVRSWFESAQDKMQLSANTKKTVLTLLTYIDSKLEQRT